MSLMNGMDYQQLSDAHMKSRVRVSELTESNANLLELLLQRDADIRQLQAELSKSQRVTAIDQSFNGLDKEEVG